jgi:hypothetical protein
MQSTRACDLIQFLRANIDFSSSVLFRWHFRNVSKFVTTLKFCTSSQSYFLCTINHTHSRDPLRAQAGFVLLADLQFDEALSHFQLSMLDPREIIALFPQLRLPTLPYEPSHPAHPCHWLANAMADMPGLAASAAGAAAGASAAGAAGGAYEPHANMADLVAHGKAARKRRSDEAREHKIEIELVRILGTRC